MYSESFDSFQQSFRLMHIIVFAFFFLVLAIIIFSILRGIGTWHRNNQSPRINTHATVVTKRDRVSVHRNANHANAYYNTEYYVTFELDSGDRIEFEVDDREYGMLVEGDQGELNFQGTRYLGFERQY